MDAVIYPRRLPECRFDIVNELHKSGRADRCGACGKAFTAARRLKSVARIKHIDLNGVEYDWTWPLCRKCTREDMQSGSVRVRLECEACAELALLVAPLGGTA